MEQLHTLRSEQSLAMEAKQHPFMFTSGIEVLENMRYGGERELSLENKYIQMREVLMTEGIVNAAAIGPTRVSKGRLLQGLARTFRQDPYLQLWAEEEKIDVDLNIYPYAFYSHTASSPAVWREYRRWALARGLQFSQYQNPDFRNIGQRNWADYQQYSLQPRKPRPGFSRVARVNLSEMNASSLPIPPNENQYFFPQEPVEVIGQDRNNSAAFTLFYDERTKYNTFLFELPNNDDVSIPAGEWRTDVVNSVDNPEKVFNREERIIFTANQNGEATEMAISELSPEAQKAVMKFLRRTMAVPGVAEKMIKDFAIFKEKMHRLGLMKGTSDSEYFRTLNRLLKPPQGRAVQVINPFLLGEKTFDLDYFLDSVPARKYPELTTEVREVLHLGVHPAWNDPYWRYDMRKAA